MSFLSCAFNHFTNNMSSGWSIARSPFLHLTFLSGKENLYVCSRRLLKGGDLLEVTPKFVIFRLIAILSFAVWNGVKGNFLDTMVIRVSNYPFLIGETLFHLALDDNPEFPLARIWRVWKLQMFHPNENLLIPLIHAGPLNGKRCGLSLC